MLKVLLKKQLQEFFAGFFVNAKTGKKHTNGSRVGLAIIVLILVLSFSSMFFSMAFLFSPVLSEENSWIYFAVFAVIASLFGIFGSVFLTYHTIYEAKDNDFLLSMPVSVPMILFSRMTGLYITTLAFESLVMLPALIVYFICKTATVASVICVIINLFILPLFALSVSCVLGWVIALFASKMRNKGVITVVISLAFFGVYYFLSMRLNTIISSITENSEAVGEWIKTYIYPLYKMSLGCSGDFLSYLAFLFIIFALFLAVYKTLSVNFIKLATSRKAMKKKVYKERAVRENSSKAALLKKEFLYFKSTPAYMLNCGLGSVIVVVIAVVLILKREDLQYIFFTLGFSDRQIPVLCALVICFVASTNNITSVSVSLDAKNLWFIRSLPVNIRDIFFSKVMLHIIVTLIPVTVAQIVCGIFFDAGVIITVLGLLTGILFVTLCALSGLCVNLIFPKLEWTNETVPIKQSMSAFVGMLVGLIYNAAIIVAYFVTAPYVSGYVFLSAATAIIFLINAVLFRWIGTKGVYRFTQL